MITLEHPRSADPFGPSIATRPRWANLFPLRTLKYFEILTKSKRSLRWKIRNRRVVHDLPVERPSWARLFPLRTLKYFEILTKSKRWLRWNLRNRRVVLDLPVEKYRDRRVFQSDNFSKNFQSPKGDYAGTSAIGRSVWTEHRDKTPMGESLSTTDLEIFWNFDKVQKVITLEHPRSADPFGPSIATRPRWANLFPLRTLKYFEILTKSKRSLRWKIRNRRVVHDLPLERPSWARLFPLRTLKYF